MEFNDELHKQLFAMFIAESNSVTYTLWDWNSENKLEWLMKLISTEYENCWEDRSVHESFMDSILREVKSE